ncbi:unnamed protein product [Timema podura]|uniref:Uncharacterized protein n=1 Tax=Timema podura TaxID=61482 RepID=A0ABN7P1Y7_TIMPD|nr:unnamed protein product [Timema podura]
MVLLFKEKRGEETGGRLNPHTASYYTIGLYAYVLITLMVFRDLEDYNLEEVYSHLPGGTRNRDSNLDLSVIGSLVYCESSALDYSATKADRRPKLF